MFFEMILPDGAKTIESIIPTSTMSHIRVGLTNLLFILKA